MVTLKGSNANAFEIERWALDDLQKEVGIWAVNTFPAGTSRSTWEKLGEEYAELGTALGTKKEGEEAADCVIALLVLCHRRGVCLADEIRRKFEINKARRSGSPTSAASINT